GVVHEVLSSEPYPGVRWSAVDALVAEWQFVASFSLPEQLVAPCLAHPKYDRCLRNEVEGRREAAGILRVPELKEAYMSWPAGWTESIVMGSRRISGESDHFRQVQAGLL